MRFPSQAVQTRTVDLDHQQLLVLQDPRGARVDVLLGGVWLTEERQLQDRFAVAGEALGLQAGGRTVVEAIGPSRVRVVEPGPRALAAWWRSVLRQHRRIEALAPRAAAALLALVLSLGLPEVIVRGVQGAPSPDHAAAAAPSGRVAA